MPFDITLSGATENGVAHGMKLFRVKTLDDGSGGSIDDAVTEMPDVNLLGRRALGRRVPP
jgi:hypothetical protein